MNVQRPVHLSAVVLLLLVFFAQVLLASPANSAAFDEEYHFATGYAYLRTGDPRLSTEHPPLVNVWNALPLLFLDPKLPLDQPAWQNATTDDFGDTFLWQTNFDRAVPIVLISRIPIAMLGLLLGAIVFRWASSLCGVIGADTLCLRSQPHRSIAALHHRSGSGVDDDTGDVAHVGVAA